MFELIVKLLCYCLIGWTLGYKGIDIRNVEYWVIILLVMAIDILK